MRIRIKHILFLFLMTGSVYLSADSFYRADTAISYKEVFSFDYEKMSHRVFLGVNNGEPFHYTSDLRTPVCEDEVCEILQLRVYWDLLGNYIGFDTIPNFPLTKYDHSPFTTDDYLKLDDLLLNGNSALASMKLSDLVVEVQNVDVDAHTGATAALIKDEVVSGAAYSCHVLWHILNIDGAAMVRAHTLSRLNDEWITTMLASKNKVYVAFLFDEFEANEFFQYESAILELLGDTSVWAYELLISSAPEAYVLGEKLQMLLSSSFEILPAMVRFQLLTLLKNQPALVEESIDALCVHLYDMSYMQIQEMGALLLKNEVRISLGAKEKLKQYINDEEARYAFLLEDLSL